MRQLILFTALEFIALGVILVGKPSVSFAQQPSSEGLPPQTPSTSRDRSLLDNSYRLGAGDRINMAIFNLPEYSQNYQILSDGTVNLPLVGIVPLEGLSLTEATETLTNRYKRYIRRPVITLDLTASRPIQLAIVGEVNRPGSYRVEATASPARGPDAPISGIPTLTQALQLAGGITQSADIRHIEVRRPLPHHSEQASVEQMNLWELLSSGNLSQDIPLQDGDTVFVPTATAVSSSEASELSQATFSPQQITVNVVGEVIKPGAIHIAPNAPLNQALLAAGGFTNRATTEAVELVRLNPDGTVSHRTIEVDLTQNVSEEKNPVLRDNDAIVVRRSSLAQTSDTASALLQPANGILGLVKLVLQVFGVI